MRVDQVVAELRRLEELRSQMEALRCRVEQMEDALESLTDCEGEIIDKMLVHPCPRPVDKICEKFEIEQAAVYRRRKKALQKLAKYLPDLR